MSGDFPPRVSVIMASWNRPQFLASAIDSVLAQTYQDFELIVADDGSAGPTHELLEAYARSPRVRVLWLTHCGVPAMVRNAALRAARGEYLAFVDSDDVWMPTKLERQLDALRGADGARWSYTGCTHIDAQGKTFEPVGVQPWRAHEGDILDAVACLRAHSALPTVMIERTLIDQAGMFDEHLALYEDHDLWLRLARLSPTVVVALPLVGIRRHDAHYSGRDELATCESRALFLERAWRCNVSPAARAELRRTRALNAARLARLHAHAGERRTAWRSLRESAVSGWRYPRWWADALRTLATAPPREHRVT